MYQQLYLNLTRQQKAQILAPDRLVAGQGSKFPFPGISDLCSAARQHAGSITTKKH